MRDAGQVARHHVGVALDHDGLHRARDVAPGQVDAVEHLALLVDRGLGGVEVLRLDPVVVEDPPGPEADRLAAGLADRPQQAPAEAVVRRPPDRDQPGRDGLLLGEALLPQVAQQGVAVARREADPELLGRRLVEAALPQELARHDGVGRGQRVGVVGLGHAVRLDQPGALGAARALGPRVALLAAQRHAVLVGEALHDLGEAQAVDLHQEGDHVAAFPAAEAVPELAGRVDVERRGLLVVEGAQALERAAAGGAEGDVVGDDVVDLGLLTHLRDVFLANPAGHVRESTAARRQRLGRIPPGIDGYGRT